MTLVGLDRGHRAVPEPLAGESRICLIGGRALSDRDCISQRGAFLRRSFDRRGRRISVPLCQLHRRTVTRRGTPANPENYGFAYGAEVPYPDRPVRIRIRSASGYGGADPYRAP